MGKRRQPIIFVLFTPEEIQKIPVNAEIIKTRKPKKPEIRNVIIVTIANVIRDVLE